MYTSTCPHCDDTFTHVTPARTLQAANLHIVKKHPGSKRLGRDDYRECDAPPARTKRAYLKRTAKPESGHAHSDQHAFQFCPSCGLNLFVLMQAMSVAAKFSKSGR